MTLNEWEQINIEVLTSREMGEWLVRRENRLLEQIRAEIDRLHYHPKLDFIKNDEVVEMALDIIDKYKAESEVRNEKG
jgi:hypothetical protein